MPSYLGHADAVPGKDPVPAQLLYPLVYRIVVPGFDGFPIAPAKQCDKPAVIVQAATGLFARKTVAGLDALAHERHGFVKFGFHARLQRKLHGHLHHDDSLPSWTDDSNAGDLIDRG